MNEAAPAMGPFGTWAMHDGIFDEVRVNWSDRTAVLLVRLFLVQGERARRCEIRCTSVRAIRVPHRDPWGPSVFINDHERSPEGLYLIEMQSGDVIEIEADQVELIPQ